MATKIITLQNMKNGNKYQNPKKILLTEDTEDKEEDNTETEKMLVSKRQFYNLVDNNNTVINQTMDDVLECKILLDREHSRFKVVSETVERQKKEKNNLENRNKLLEKELDSYKTKNKISSDASQIISKNMYKVLSEEEKMKIVKEKVKRYDSELEEFRKKYESY